MTPKLNVYSPYSYHSEAYIIGSREGLEALRDTLTKALEASSGEARSDACATTDDEGFRLIVAVRPDEILDSLALPYTAWMSGSHFGSQAVPGMAPHECVGYFDADPEDV